MIVRPQFKLDGERVSDKALQIKSGASPFVAQVGKRKILPKLRSSKRKHWVLGRFIIAVVESMGLVESRPQIFLYKVVCWMTTVRVKENEPFEVALRRFKRSIRRQVC